MSSSFFQPRTLGVLVLGVGLGLAISLGMKHLKVLTAKPETMAVAEQKTADTEPKVLYW